MRKYVRGRLASFDITRHDDEGIMGAADHMMGQTRTGLVLGVSRAATKCNNIGRDG